MGVGETRYCPNCKQNVATVAETQWALGGLCLLGCILIGYFVPLALPLLMILGVFLLFFCGLKPYRCPICKTLRSKLVEVEDEE